MIKSYKIIPTVDKYESAAVLMLSHPKMENIPSEFKEVIMQMAKGMDTADPMIKSLTKQNDYYRKTLHKIVKACGLDNETEVPQ
jgi:hypothetical protein